MIKRIFLQAVVVCCITLSSKGQNVPVGFELQEIIRISEAYRLMPYLSFNVNYQYADSAQPTVIAEEIAGQYKIHEGRYWAQLDSTELLQGNNYHLSVYHDEKVLVVAKPNLVHATVLQLSFLDSLFERSFVEQMNVTTINDSTRKLQVSFKPESPFVKYEIYYHPVTYRIGLINYYQKDQEQQQGNSGTSLIKVNFSNYSEAIISNTYFEESKYVNKVGTQFHPTALVSDFEVIVRDEF